MKHKKKMIGAIILIVGLVLVTTLRNKEAPQSQGLVEATECPAPAVFSTTCVGIAKESRYPEDPEGCRWAAGSLCRLDCWDQLLSVCGAYCIATPGCRVLDYSGELTGCVGQGPNAGICTATGSLSIICVCAPTGTGPQPP